MYIKCISNGGFEDQLTTSATYKVKKVGENSYQVENDVKQQRWYGQSHFKIQIS